MRLFKRKYIKVRRDAWRMIRQGMKVSMANEAELRAYRESELSPNEIHLMSERLTEFELAELEPKEVRELADRDKSVKGELRHGAIYCPACGELLCTPKYAEKMKFCNKCGKRVDTAVTEETPSPVATTTLEGEPIRCD